MELGLSLGDASKPMLFGFTEKAPNNKSSSLGFCMGLSIGSRDHHEEEEEDRKHNKKRRSSNSSEYSTTTITTLRRGSTAITNTRTRSSLVVINSNIFKSNSGSETAPIQLDLLPNTPLLRTPPPHNPDNNGSGGGGGGRGFDVKNRLVDDDDGGDDVEDGRVAVSSSPPNSAASSFQMDLCIYKAAGGGGGGGTQDHQVQERGSPRASDEDENGSGRKKLRLSKNQSAFLEESFREHHTLNPKQKLALAKQLNLRPRQVEVWFQNRRARTKLKQTEVDCEYLKRCCETLTEENRRLHKELQELRALKTSNSFFMQLPATTLTMCPSCERVGTTTTTTTAAAVATTPTTTNNNNNNSSTATDPTITGLSLMSSGPKLYPFSITQPHHQNKSNTSSAS